MTINELIVYASQLLFRSRSAASAGKHELAINYLSILRSLLNAEPQLEAGGALAERRKPK